MDQRILHPCARSILSLFFSLFSRTHLSAFSFSLWWEPVLASLTSWPRLSRLPWQPRDTSLTRLSAEARCSHIANARITGASRTTLDPWESRETFLSECAEPSVALQIKCRLYIRTETQSWTLSTRSIAASLSTHWRSGSALETRRSISAGLSGFTCWTSGSRSSKLAFHSQSQVRVVGYPFLSFTASETPVTITSLQEDGERQKKMQVKSF